MKVLLAIDDSSFSQAAVEAVKAQYKPADCEVLVLHALDMLSPYAGMTALDPSALKRVFEGERRVAEVLLERVEEELRAAGFLVSSTLRMGEARNVILEVASKWQADQIVIGSHGRGGFERLMLGSVSLAVARHSPCSVEIVRST